MNARINQIKNAQFYQNDAGRFMVQLAEAGEHVDVVFMDPPRNGSTEEFMNAVFRLKPDKVVYISCNPETLARDLQYFAKGKYQMKEAVPVDMFPFTEHVETVCLMSRVEGK